MYTCVCICAYMYVHVYIYIFGFICLLRAACLTACLSTVLFAYL